VLHISGSNALLSKHQRESTDGFRQTQDVSMTPNASPTGPREVKLKHFPKNSLILQSILQSLHPPPTRAAHVNSRISIKEVSISVHAHMHIYTLHTTTISLMCVVFNFLFKSGKQCEIDT